MKLTRFPKIGRIAAGVGLAGVVLLTQATGAEARCFDRTLWGDVRVSVGDFTGERNLEVVNNLITGDIAVVTVWNQGSPSIPIAIKGGESRMIKYSVFFDATVTLVNCNINPTCVKESTFKVGLGNNGDGFVPNP